MTAGWMAPIERALDARTSPLPMFFRNDDAGWADDRLFPLLDLFERHRCPIDLAVIPAALSPALCLSLAGRVQAGASVGLHQHGFAHTNHERTGRKCEFGDARSATAQRHDIVTGKRMLEEAFGLYLLDAIFTPPWNRCTPTTGGLLVQCGIRTLSRDSTAGALDVEGLAECPIRLDWLASRKGLRLSRDEWAAEAARAIDESAEPLGVMFHHAVMDEEDLRACDAFLGAVIRHPVVDARLMRHAGARHGAGRES